MQAIGIDIGTTSICAVVIDKDGTLIKSVTKNSEAFIASSSVWEKIQDVGKIINLAKIILDELIDENTKVIGVTGQMHGIVYTDADGLAVSPLYTWQDGRGNLPYKDTTYADFLGSCSGFGNVTDFYNRENGLRPENAVAYCTIHDYFVMNLCGLKTPVIHSSDAQSFGMYNLKNNKFEYEYGFNGEITSEYRICGEYKGIPVSVAIGDNQASVFSTLSDENDILFNVGTGSQISVVSKKIKNGENIETRPYFENKYLLVGAALCGGRAYSMLERFYSKILEYVHVTEEKDVYSIMDKMLSDAKQSPLKVNTRFAGTRKNKNIMGSIEQITTENFTPANLAQGVLEGMAEELLDMYEEMGEQKAGIVGSGNGIRKNPALVRIFEKKFGLKMKIPCHLEEAAFGAAMFAFISCGLFKNAEEAKMLIKYE